eukprot:8967306-Alexandrium_andersonii.AAC.1
MPWQDLEFGWAAGGSRQGLEAVKSKLREGPVESSRPCAARALGFGESRMPAAAHASAPESGRGPG